ncbi:ABC transporter ATP-binding protein [Acidaminobacter sp. JC074]|uniref:ABC transporter ATP-binding protein n=1 Tax=Acidaminobacter sp. JC074 TaxID=2530199 RepID=UPI001F0FF34E|nr:ABC transporter ATP-binding protein [Acidaminobacter sp. JC074]MCH4887056.1 ABC transporter ATP-binding protein [Acidaminobacter sp. JC074]
MENIIDVKNLTVKYFTDEGTVHAVNDISFEINRGETLGLVGETGAGKTTTALSLLRLLQSPPGEIVDGDIVFDKDHILTLSEDQMRLVRGGKISMIFQDPMTSLNPVLTIGDQIAEVIQIHMNCGGAEARIEGEEMLERVGIPKERYDEYPHQFSGGMKQRVVIAIALACKPSLLIADEPTTALDVTIQAQVIEMMKDLQKQINTAMLLITHDLGVVADSCDHVAIMYAGEIIESGSLEDIFDNPCHPYTNGLFGSIPSLDKDVKKLSPITGDVADPTHLPTGCHFHPRCKYAEPVCKNKRPMVTSINDTHQVKCLIYESLLQTREVVKYV